MVLVWPKKGDQNDNSNDDDISRRHITQTANYDDISRRQQ